MLQTLMGFAFLKYKKGSNVFTNEKILFLFFLSSVATRKVSLGEVEKLADLS